MDKGEETRERILARAEALLLRRGYAGASLNEIVAASGVSKGAFFHHFAGKGELARAILDRYARNDLAMFEGLVGRARAAGADPLDQAIALIAGFGAFIQSEGAPKGCVFASYVYQPEQFDADVRRSVADYLRAWTDILAGLFADLVAARPSVRPVTARGLASMFASLVEGGLIFSRAQDDHEAMLSSLDQFAQYLTLLFPKVTHG